jgi:S-adenosylmethionine:tRNA ribosyltransferase-isomerase
MRVSDFIFELPSKHIAQQPAEPRDSARLLHVPARAELADLYFTDLPSLLLPGDLLVTNNTRVIPARLTGNKGSGAKIEVTLHKSEGPGLWWVFARPAKKLKQNDFIQFAPKFTAVVEKKSDAGEVMIRFNVSGVALMEALQTNGVMPLPPYIKRPHEGYQTDQRSYQTMFAQNDGAVAAPTASLHFTPSVVHAITDRGVGIVQLTLHVGAGTYLPIKVDDTKDHIMHSEWGEISTQVAEQINQVKQNGGRIIVSGTTSLRLLETATTKDGIVVAFQGETDIFITPGYKFRAANLMLTNFHLPKSTLFMLVAAFAGLNEMKQAYQHAMDKNYRFYSYGDASLVELAQNPPRDSS